MRNSKAPHVSSIEMLSNQVKRRYYSLFFLSLYVLVLIVLISLLSAQYPTGIPYKGVVVDAETQDAIPYAHVESNGNVIITNSEGLFFLRDHSIGDEVCISYIGYETQCIIVENKDKIANILLKHASVELEEVSIVTAKNILKDFRNRVLLNYEVSPYNAKAFYKETLQSDNNLLYIAEGQFDVFIPSNLSPDKIKAKMIKSRSKVLNKRALNHFHWKGNVCDMALTSIWREGSFLSQKEISRYEFSKSDYAKINNRYVFRIRFEPKSGNLFEGEIFIDEKSKAVIRLSYWNTSPPNRANADSVAWSEDYVFHEGVTKLVKTTYHEKFKVNGSDYYFDALLLFDVDHSTVELDPNDYLTESDIFVFQSSNDFSEEFWEENNFLILEEHIQSELGLIDKTN